MQHMDKQQYIAAVTKAKDNQRPKPVAIRQCCATCDLLSDTGECTVYGEYPPLDYLEAENECAEYVHIPF